MARISWTINPVTVANTARDGSGTLYRVLRVESPSGQYVDHIDCHSFGTNAATEVVLLGTNGNGIANENNNFLLGSEAMIATTLGTSLTTDSVTFTIGAWFDQDFEIYALVHATQAAGRQFVAFSDASYQVSI